MDASPVSSTSVSPQVISSPHPADESIMAMSENRTRTVLLDFEGEQFSQDMDELASTTLVHISLYIRFLRRMKPIEAHNMPASVAKIRNRQRRFAHYQGKRYSVYTSTNLPVQIDGCTLHVPCAITFDERLRRRIILGKDAFKCMSVMQCEMKGNEAKLNLDSSCSTIAAFNTASGIYYANVLLDTGAGPSIMSLAMWQRLADQCELIADNTPLMAANSQTMKIIGRTQPLSFKLGDLQVVMSFLVSEVLGKREVILGRDFMFTYDVTMDVSKGTAIVNNAKGSYIRKRVIEIKEGKSSVLANCEVSTTIPTVGIHPTAFKLCIPHPEEWEGRPVAVLPYPKSNSCLIPARTLTTVRNNTLWAPLLNMSEE